MPQGVEGQLVGTWRHSHEEDTATETVYRPEDYAFPPARGRTGFSFRADKTCTYLGISPRDGTARESCRWGLAPGARPQLIVSWPDGRRESRRIVSVDAQRLVLEAPE
ncbi:MAG TPA: hypothetical protein PLH72_17010 [Vicinamibacterales bacterium]|nr:hypothetical protein [Vicinamibacterales bacterium]